MARNLTKMMDAFSQIKPAIRIQDLPFGYKDVAELFARGAAKVHLLPDLQDLDSWLSAREPFLKAVGDYPSLP